jgi:hypothetical protein
MASSLFNTNIAAFSYQLGWALSGASAWMAPGYLIGPATNIEHKATLFVGLDLTTPTETDYFGDTALSGIAGAGGFGIYGTYTRYTPNSTGECVIGDTTLSLPPLPSSNDESLNVRGFRVNWAGWLIDWHSTTNGFRYR